MKTNSKAQNALTLINIAILASAMVFGLIACPNDPTPQEPQATLRYENVPAGRVSPGRVVNENDRFLLMDSAYDDDYYYYLYYLGYVNNAPILYKDSFRYEGIGVQTISFEKSWATEEALTTSMSKATEETIQHNWNVTAHAEFAHKGSIFGFADSQIKIGLDASYGQEISKTISVSNTWETSKTKVESETQILSVELDSSDPKGTYRYVLFGILDYFCLFTVDKTTFLPVEEAKITQCARESGLTWGLDFEPLSKTNNLFGKTAPGEPFSAPNIDFSKLPVPDKEYGAMEGAPEKEPDLIKTWSEKRTNTRLVTDQNYAYEPYTINPLFEMDKLRDEGYDTFHCTLEFQAKEIYDGYVEIYVIATHANTYGDVVRAPEWKRWWSCTQYSDDKIDLPSSGWQTIKKEFDVPFSVMVSDQTFTICWAASGGFDDDYDLGTRTITIEVKENTTVTP